MMKWIAVVVVIATVTSASQLHRRERCVPTQLNLLFVCHRFMQPAYRRAQPSGVNLDAKNSIAKV